jgi:hypothetical protein
MEFVPEFVSGERIGSISLFKNTFKNTMIQLLQGYPLYYSFGIWETYFGESVGKRVVARLKDDGLLETREIGDRLVYRLSPRGVELALYMINFENSQKMENIAWAALGVSIAALVISIIGLWI